MYILHCSYYFSYSYGDPKLQMWIDWNNDFLREIGNGLPADFVPILKHFPNKQTKKFLQILEDTLEATQHEMKAHRESFDPGKVSKR